MCANIGAKVISDMCANTGAKVISDMLANNGAKVISDMCAIKSEHSDTVRFQCLLSVSPNNFAFN